MVFEVRKFKLTHVYKELMTCLGVLFVAYFGRERKSGFSCGGAQSADEDFLKHGTYPSPKLSWVLTQDFAWAPLQQKESGQAER